MRALILGALLGLLLLFPPLLAFVAAVACKPLVVAFTLGLVARPHLHRLRWWSQ